MRGSIALRVFAGRVLLGSDEGGRTAAILTSITATCKRLGVDPFDYLRDIFQRISTHPQNSLDDLLPDKWKLARPSPVC
jgi:hypothetical protein